MSEQTLNSSALQPSAIGSHSQVNLRLWPAALLLAILVLTRIWANVGDLGFGKMIVSIVLTPLVAFLGTAIWWAFFSRMPRSDRKMAIIIPTVLFVAMVVLCDAKFRGTALITIVAPLLVVCWVGWLLISVLIPWRVRLAGVYGIFAATAVICCALRSEGVRGSNLPELTWRWSATSEQKYLASLRANAETFDGPSIASPTGGSMSTSAQSGDWPSFRGPARDSRLAGVQIKTDWDKSPPKELWRHLIGPGWSSFSVVGNHLFTQEQRGDDEYVVCLDAGTGKEIWSHHNEQRFDEAMSGPGPRATPTFDGGRLYVLGANGTLDCLDAASGKAIWSHDIKKDAGAKAPMWGFSSSPLVAHGIVSVYAGGPLEKAVIGYQADTGNIAWTAGVGESSTSYSSPQLVTIDGTEQILMVTNLGLAAIEPIAGKILWNYEWPVGPVVRCIQPTLVGDRDLLIGTGMGQGTRRISVSHHDGQWESKQEWATKKFKPYFNDLVVVDDCIYGFDGSAFMCISMKDQTSKWRTGDYGAGQVLLLADQKLLLILSERGEVALVKAQPEKHDELCKFKAIEGKTWNHPVIAHGKLFVRNGEEIACFKLEPLDGLAGNR